MIVLILKRFFSALAVQNQILLHCDLKEIMFSDRGAALSWGSRPEELTLVIFLQCPRTSADRKGHTRFLLPVEEHACSSKQGSVCLWV